MLTASIQHKLSPDAVLRNRTLLSSNKTTAAPSPLGAVERAGGGTPSFADPLAILSAPRQDRDRVVHDRSLVNQTDLIDKQAVGGVQHTLIAGIELGARGKRRGPLRLEHERRRPPVNLGTPVVGPRPGERALSRTVQTTADTLAAYVNDQIDLDAQWKLVAGLRAERFKARSTLQKFALPAGFPADTTEPAPAKSQTIVSPRAGAMYPAERGAVVLRVVRHVVQPVGRER